MEAWMALVAVAGAGAVFGAWRAAGARGLLPWWCSRPPLPRMSRLEDLEARLAAQSIVNARRNLVGVLRSLPSNIARPLCAVLSPLPAVEARAGGLIRRMDALGRFLGIESVEQVNGVRTELAVSAGAARLEDTRLRYEQARALAQGHLEALEQVVAARDGLKAEVQALVAFLEGLPSRVVRLRLLEGESWRGAPAPEEADSLDLSLRSFEDAFASVAGEVETGGQ